MTDNAPSHFYKTAVELSFGCVATLDDHGRIIRFQSYIDDIPEDAGPEIVGKKLTHVFIPVDNQASEHRFSRLVKTKSNLPETLLTKYAGSIYVEWKLKPLETRTGQDDKILCAGIEVTRHVQLKQQLHHAERLATVGQLAAGIAHEINGPLNNILGYAQLSAKQQDLPEQVYGDLDNIIRMSLHAREVVKKVMLFSRQVPPKHDRVCLNQVIRESLYFTEPLCSKNKIQMTCQLNDGLPRILGDFAQLRQVVVNLVVNAVQAMPAGDGKITISTGYCEQNRRLTMTVQDTGTGMTKETLSQCFDPFFTTKAFEEGTGLGLSVVHGILKAHGADTDVTSQTGKGTCFNVSFAPEPEKGVPDAP
jgi:signal transduction histidine kinase